MVVTRRISRAAIRFLRCALLPLVAVARAEEVFNTTPAAVRTSFSCLNRPMGFYADTEANCRVYHTCDDHGNKFTYRCPEETAFRQDALICDHAHLVDCRTTVHPPGVRLPSVDGNNVIQRPGKSAPANKHQPGFVFSASLFLRDHQDRRIAEVRRTCDDVRSTASAGRAAAGPHFDVYWNARKDKPGSLPRQRISSPESRVSAPVKSAVYPRRSFEPTASTTFARVPGLVQRPPPPPGDESLAGRDHHRPYSETLRSIQANAVRTTVASVRPSPRSTTEIPVHALTLALKPLVPNELEYDPYYPRQPTSTEAYYTPGANARPSATSGRTPPPTVARLSLPFEIPSVLPDLNGLEDLVDRRKFFYIPRVNVKSTTS